VNANAGYLDWPFRPEMRSDEQQQRWRRECYLPAAADRQLGTVDRWLVLAGPPGSGKSVALQTWLDHRAADTLHLPYPPDRWPGAAAAYLPHEPSHLAQMLALAGENVAARLRHDPAAARLDEYQRGFLRALLQRHGGAGRYHTFLRTLPAELRPVYEATTAADVFGAGDTPVGISALMQELVLLSEALDCRRVLFTIDPPQPLTPADMAGLGDLLGRLDLTDNPDFLVAVAVRDETLRGSNVLERARARVHLVYTSWTADECRVVANNHLRCALPDAPLFLEELLTAAALDEAQARLVAEFGGHSPAGWLYLAETALYATQRAIPPTPPPIDAAGLPALWRLLFQRHIPLRLDEVARCAWRGARRLELDEQPFKLLLLLRRRRGRTNIDVDLELEELASSSANLYSIVSRARKVIEPDPDTPIYLLHQRGLGGGYWLEEYQRLHS
jgi:hypothetical protein